MALEKLAVETRPTEDGKCPVCGSKVTTKGGAYWCPKCGTAPFEVKRGTDGEEKVS